MTGQTFLIGFRILSGIPCFFTPYIAPSQKPSDTSLCSVFALLDRSARSNLMSSEGQSKIRSFETGYPEWYSRHHQAGELLSQLGMCIFELPLCLSAIHTLNSCIMHFAFVV
jgi:hypothetical protein